MARRDRIHLPTATYHIIHRGNGGQQIFFSDEDRNRMCILLQDGVERFDHRIHSFCFMTNHIHLAIQVANDSISRIIQNVAFRYASYINKKQKKVGHLFQGRFKSILVVGDLYLRELVRYIHLNPVRAGIVKHPEEYLWSSHRAYIQDDKFSWLTCNYVLGKFDGTVNEAISNYNRYILEGIGEQSNLNFESGSRNGVLGNEESIDELFDKIDVQYKQEIELSDLMAKICKRYGISENALCRIGKNRLASHARAVLALLVRESENLSFEDLAHFLNRDSSGLSKLARRIEDKCLKSKTVEAEINDLRSKISNVRMSGLRKRRLKPARSSG